MPVPAHPRQRGPGHAQAPSPAVGGPPHRRRAAPHSPDRTPEVIRGRPRPPDRGVCPAGQNALRAGVGDEAPDRRPPLSLRPFDGIRDRESRRSRPGNRPRPASWPKCRGGTSHARIVGCFGAPDGCAPEVLDAVGGGVRDGRHRRQPGTHSRPALRLRPGRRVAASPRGAGRAVDRALARGRVRTRRGRCGGRGRGGPMVSGAPAGEGPPRPRERRAVGAWRSGSARALGAAGAGAA